MGYTFETMSDDRLAEFMAEPRNAIVGTIRANGSTHLSPAWFLYDDGKLHVPVLKSSVKYRNLSRDSRISVCVDGAFPNLSAVMINGTSEFLEGEPERDLYLRICRRYYDNDADNEQGSRTFHEWGDAVTVVVTPTRILTQDYANWE